MKLTQTILKEISFQVTTGNPWWGLILANEYLSPDSDLHRALYKRAIDRLGSSSIRHPLARKVRQGHRANMLSAALRRSIGCRIVPTTKAPMTHRAPRALTATMRRRPVVPRSMMRSHHSHRASIKQIVPSLQSYPHRDSELHLALTELQRPT